MQFYSFPTRNLDIAVALARPSAAAECLVHPKQVDRETIKPPQEYVCANVATAWCSDKATRVQYPESTYV